jgi:hypothetical protein
MHTNFEHLADFYEVTGEWDDGRVEYTLLNGYNVECNGTTATVINVKDGVVVECATNEDYTMRKVPASARWRVYKEVLFLEFAS